MLSMPKGRSMGADINGDLPSASIQPGANRFGQGIDHQLIEYRRAIAIHRRVTCQDNNLAAAEARSGIDDVKEALREIMASAPNKKREKIHALIERA